MFNQFYAKYREIILFNKNIIIAAISAFVADALVVQYSAERLTDNNIIISILSIMTDTGVYLATFMTMFLIDNRNTYVNTETGKKDSTRFRRDVKRIIAAMGISEVVYMIVKFTSIYAFLQLNVVAPYQAAMFTTLLAWIFYVITANIIIMMMFRRFSR
ncbi:MAG TPA: hypothetical protein VNI77_06680 [Nitrososphaera sp.]|nr:hypothetical protein [Nitrososphaera sp.]